jgi:hypothetical protein
MPRDDRNRYWIRGAFQTRSISRMTTTLYSRARNSTRTSPLSYPTPEEIVDRMDVEGNTWYVDVGEDLFLRDFVWQARMQTARRQEERSRRFPGRDRVLERLITEGTFDRQDPDSLVTSEEFAMAHASAMTQRLLMRIEFLEGEVSDFFRDLLVTIGVDGHDP